MIYWKLFSTFFLIGAFCFGGGYAAIPLIQDTVISNGWMSMNEFMNMIKGGLKENEDLKSIQKNKTVREQITKSGKRKRISERERK